MRLRKQISLFLSFAISITSMNVTALSNSISGMTKKAKAADIVLASSPEPTNNAICCSYGCGYESYIYYRHSWSGGQL